MSKRSIAVIGAGVVGLAATCALARRGWEVTVIEREDGIGRGTSSRNSEVLHAGIYYPQGTLKANLCVKGLEQLVQYCRINEIPFRQMGKLIVALDDEDLPQLREIQKRAHANGAKEVRLIGSDEMIMLEPSVKGVAALFSPKTGIIDSHSLMRSLYLEATRLGATFAFHTEISSIEKGLEQYSVKTLSGDKIEVDAVVNSAGLFAEKIAAAAGLDTGHLGYRLRYVKGSYFRYVGQSPVKHLIYPVPHKNLTGLGVHGTLDLAGRLRFGPDVEPVETINYDIDSAKRDAFYESASRLIAGLDRELFQPDTSGIRPKLIGDGVRDFAVNEETANGLPGFVNLLGIESPGLTASLAIADRVVELLEPRFGS